MVSTKEMADPSASHRRHSSGIQMQLPFRETQSQKLKSLLHWSQSVTLGLGSGLKPSSVPNRRSLVYHKESSSIYIVFFFANYHKV